MSDWVPFWTEEAQIENGGRYPLLLNRFHDHLENYLIKGIVSTTDRLRYISYCCWAIGDIENSMNCKQYFDFEEAFRWRESAFALGSWILKPKTALGNYKIYGSEVMGSMGDREDTLYDLSFRILPSQALGAFGQYYKGTMQNWGLIYTDENGIIRLQEFGRELYLIMNEFYKGTEYFQQSKGKRRVSGKILKEWAKKNEYDNIRNNENKDERDFYKKILFHLDSTDEKEFRRDSLMIYLECISECNKVGTAFTEDYLRNILYFQQYRVEKQYFDFKVSPFLEDARFYWSIYEIQVYFRWFIEEYLRYFLKELSPAPKGLTDDEVMSHLEKDSFNEKVAEVTNVKQDYFNLQYSQLIKTVMEADKTKVVFMEDWLGENYSSFSDLCASLLMLLPLLNEKYQNIRNDDRFCKVRLFCTSDYWFAELLDLLDSWDKLPIQEVLKNILNRFVIQKHDIRMYIKRDLRKCWFTKSGEEYQFQADSRSIWRPAKHEIICNFLFDMKLVSIKEDCIIISSEGQKLYKVLKEECYEK